MRIVSLLASATEIVCALGLEDRLVGISHECDFPPRALDRPRVSRPRFDPAGMSSGEVDRAVRQAMSTYGSVYTVDAEQLQALKPDVIFTQAVCEVCAVPTAGVAALVERRGLDARVVSLDAHDLDGILETILQVGEACGVDERAHEVVDGLRRRLDHLRTRLRDVRRPRLLALEWLDPPFAPGHWVPELVTVAGARNLVGEPGARSAEIAWDRLQGLEPEALVVMPCGFGLDASREDADAHAGRLLEVAEAPIREGRAWVVDASSYFNRSGPRAVDGAEILAGLLHPDLVEPPPADVAAPWQPEESAARSR